MARTTLYADFDLATGGETGADAVNAWRTMQDAIDGKNGSAPVADTILCTGTDTISTLIDMDQGSGDLTDGMLIFRGVNSSFVNDGTRAIIDANNNAINIINFNGPDGIRIENFEYKNTSSTGYAITASGYSSTYNIQHINCIFDDLQSAMNLSAQSMRSGFFHKCQFLNSRSITCNLSFGNQFIFSQCIFSASAAQSIRSIGSGYILIDCYVIASTGNAIEYNPSAAPNIIDAWNLIYNTTIDGGSDGIQTERNEIVIGSRITNTTVGIDSDSIVTLLNSYMPNSTEDRDNTTNTVGIVDEIVIDGSNSNNLSGTDTDAGYTDPAGGDFNLDESKASQYNQEIDLES